MCRYCESDRTVCSTVAANACSMLKATGLHRRCLWAPRAPALDRSSSPKREVQEWHTHAKIMCTLHKGFEVHKNIKNVFLFHTHEVFACIFLCEQPYAASRPEKGIGFSRSGVSRWLWAAMRVLGTKHRSFASAVSALTCWVISATHRLIFHTALYQPTKYSCASII